MDANAIWHCGFLERTANGVVWLKQGMPRRAQEIPMIADAWADAGAP